MEIKIGINNIAREVVINAVASPDEVAAALSTALAQPHGLLELHDERGRRVIVPVAQLAYLDLGDEHTRPVGFGAA